MWVLTGERERFWCIHIIGESIRMTALLLTTVPLVAGFDDDLHSDDVDARRGRRKRVNS
jgi:hypothetical protein